MRHPTNQRIGGGIVNALRPQAPPFIIWAPGNEIYLTRQTTPNAQAGTGQGFIIRHATQYKGRSFSKYYPGVESYGRSWGRNDVTY